MTLIAVFTKLGGLNGPLLLYPDPIYRKRIKLFRTLGSIKTFVRNGMRTSRYDDCYDICIKFLEFNI